MFNGKSFFAAMVFGALMSNCWAEETKSDTALYTFYAQNPWVYMERKLIDEAGKQKETISSSHGSSIAFASLVVATAIIIAHDRNESTFEKFGCLAGSVIGLGILFVLWKAIKWDLNSHSGLYDERILEEFLKHMNLKLIPQELISVCEKLQKEYLVGGSAYCSSNNALAILDGMRKLICKNNGIER
jgi:hypothetical protein